MTTKAFSAKILIFLLALFATGSVTFCREGVGTQSSPSNAEAAHWRIYRSQEYGFEVKYPPGFNVSEDPAGYIVFTAPHANSQFGLSISRPRVRGKLTLAEFVHDDTAYEKDNSYSYAMESVVSKDGMTIYRYQRILGSSARQGIFFLKNPTEGTMSDYLIEYDRCNGGGCGPDESASDRIIKNPYAKQYDQILSTFRLIQSAATDGGQ